MSLVTEVRFESKQMRERQEARTTYSVCTFPSGKRVQIQSYGRSDREEPDTVSQVMQFDEKSARQLVDILRREFNF